MYVPRERPPFSALNFCSGAYHFHNWQNISSGASPFYFFFCLSRILSFPKFVYIQAILRRPRPAYCRQPERKNVRPSFTVSQLNQSEEFVLVQPSSVASFLVLGGGGGTRPPNVPTHKICTYIVRASEASERLRNTYFQDSKYICIHTQSMHFRLITYGMAL